MSPGAERGTELILLLCTCIVAFTTTMSMLGPLLLQLSSELQVNLATAGLLATATSLPWALGAPFLGPLSDRFGRRRTLALSLVGLGILTGTAALTTSFASLFAVRVLSGLMAAAGPTSVTAAVADHFPSSRRASALGWVNSGFGIAALAGVPAIGAVGGVYGWRIAFLLMGLLTIPLALLVWLRLPGGIRPTAGGSTFSGAYRTVLTTAGLRPILAANILERSVFASVGLYLAPYMMQTYGLDLLEVAPLLGLTALGTIVGNVVGGRLADRGHQPRLFTLGQIVAAVFGLLFFVLRLHPVLSIAVGASFGLANAASRPAILAMASAISTRHRGTALGIFSFTNQTGWALGPLLSSVSFAVGGYTAIGLVCGVLSLGAAAVMCLLLVAPKTD